MAVSLTTQWTLVASGLVAHADHVLTGEECDRLMTMVDQQIDGDDYAHWMAAIGDRAQLETLLDGLAAPRPECREQILEAAWLMAVVDGERADEELEILGTIARRLGVEPATLDGWVEAWTAAQHDYAEVAATALAWVLAGSEAVTADALGPLEQFVHTLPTTHEHRDALLPTAAAARSAESVEQRAQALGRVQRRDLVWRLSEVAEDIEAASAKERLASLSAALEAAGSGKDA